MNEEIRVKVWETSLANRGIILNSEIDERVIETIVKQIFDINAEDDELEAAAKNYSRKDNPITIYINSPGGSALDTLSVVSAIESSKTPVHTTALGYAMSGGFLILIAGHKRFAQKYTTLMWHQANGGMRGEVGRVREWVVETDRLMKMIDDIIKNKTKLTQDKLDDIYNAKLDWHIGSKEAKKLGIIDDII